LAAALKSAGVALTASGTPIASGETASVIADVVVVEDTDGAGKGGEGEDDGGERVREHLGNEFLKERLGRMLCG